MMMGGNSADGKDWLDMRTILEVEVLGFDDRLWDKRKRRAKSDSSQVSVC